MAFYQQLQDQTEQARNAMLSSVVIEQSAQGNVTRDMYIAFLSQAFYHVSHTVPLLMSAGSRLPAEKEWLRAALAEYIEEEYGHHEWILNDIRACGGDAEAVRNGAPGRAIELMLAYLYYRIERVNPLCIFGMVHVLEGTSVNIATPIAESLQHALKLSEEATTYLRSHGALDLEHLKFFASLMDKVTDAHDQQDIVHTANVVYALYGDMLRALAEVPDGTAQ